MICHLIEGFQGKYGIQENGEVIVLKSYREKDIGTLKKKYSNDKKESIGVSLYDSEKNIALFKNSNTLMREYFNLKPPDTHHIYDLKHKDNNPYNHSLDNFIWVMRLHKDYKYPIKIFYNKQGCITHKICGDCGKKLLYKNFRKHRKGSVASKNSCSKCIDIRDWKSKSSTKERRDKIYKVSRKFLKSDKGKLWLKTHLKKDRNNLSNWYLNALIKHKYGEIKNVTEDFKEVVKLQVKIKREIKNQLNN